MLMLLVWGLHFENQGSREKSSWLCYVKFPKKRSNWNMVRENNLKKLVTWVLLPALSQNDQIADKQTHAHTTEYHITSQRWRVWYRWKIQIFLYILGKIKCLLWNFKHIIFPEIIFKSVYTAQITTVQLYSFYPKWRTYRK